MADVTARDVIAKGLRATDEKDHVRVLVWDAEAEVGFGDWIGADSARAEVLYEVADAILAALAEAGYSVVETVRGTDPDSPFRRVEGGE